MSIGLNKVYCNVVMNLDEFNISNKTLFTYGLHKVFPFQKSKKDYTMSCPIKVNSNTIELAQ